MEEAAEILESQLLACLTSEAQHLIMIGDHQQLQPGVTCYQLKKEKNLAVSLFERLIRNQLVYVSLREQRRMHPDISSLVQFVYKRQGFALLNHPDVEARKFPGTPYLGVPGVRSRVFLWHHDKRESDAGVARSHVNKHEIAMASQCTFPLLLVVSHASI